MRLLRILIAPAIAALPLAAQEKPAPAGNPAQPPAQPAPAPSVPKETAEPAEPVRKGAGGLPEVEVEIKTPEARKAQEEFLKLPAEKRDDFVRLMGEGQNMLGQKRIQDALTKFNEAEPLWPLHPNLLNLKGAALVNLRDFERATAYFEKAVSLYPEFWQARFNLAEMWFVKKDFPKARAAFEDLITRQKQIEGATRRLLDYKIILCLIKEGKTEDAKKLMNRYDIFDDTPVFFYANAAMHFEKGEKKQAEEWVSNARNIYPSGLTSIFEDSLSELGYLFVF